MIPLKTTPFMSDFSIFYNHFNSLNHTNRTRDIYGNEKIHFPLRLIDSILFKPYNLNIQNYRRFPTIQSLVNEISSLCLWKALWACRWSCWWTWLAPVASAFPDWKKSSSSWFCLVFKIGLFNYKKGLQKGYTKIYNFYDIIFLVDKYFSIESLPWEYWIWVSCGFCELKKWGI